VRVGGQTAQVTGLTKNSTGDLEGSFTPNVTEAPIGAMERCARVADALTVCAAILSPVPGRPRIHWFAAEVYYLQLDPWYPGQLGKYGLYRRSWLIEALRPRAVRRTYANVGRTFGVSRQAVQQHARRHGWKELAQRFDAEWAARARSLRH
jgi:hypothetical protein